MPTIQQQAIEFVVVQLPNKSQSATIMPLRTESLEEPSLNLTPMIDIVFLLIIFFMVGTRFSEIEQQFDIETPKAVALAPMSAAPDPVVVNVTRAGRISIGNAELTLDELKSRLEEARQTFAQQTVLIRGDGESIYQSVIDVMSVCHQAQVHKFSLAFQPLREDQP